MKKQVNQNNKQVNQKDRLTLVVSLMSKGLTPSKIAKRLKVSKPYISKLIRPLKEKGLIKNKGYGVWEVNQNINKLTDFSLGTRINKPTTNLHALQINFPILEGKIKDKNWEIKEKLNHWLPKYKGLIILGGLTLKNNNNKSITVFAKSRNIKKLEDIDILANQIRAYVPQYFKIQGVILDNINCKTSNLNIATEDKPAGGMLRKGEKFELKFNKQAEKIFPRDNLSSKAWMDGSPFKFTAETNDKDWKRNYLKMPFTIRDLAILNVEFNKNLEVYNKNIKLHLSVLNEIKKAIKRLGK